MPRSNFTRFKDGVSIAGVCLNVHQKGKVLYVCNSAVTAPLGVGGAGSDGRTPELPLATITQALALSVANRGDKIILLPGHSEKVSAAAGLAINVAGVSIIADPSAIGSQTPTITLDTASTATITITANDVLLQGVLIVANFLNIATAIDITTALNTRIWDVEFRDTSAVLNLVKAIRTDTTDNHADGLNINNVTYNGLGTSAATSLLNARGVVDRLTVTDNMVNVQGTTATTGVLILATSKAITHAIVYNNVAMSLYTGSAGALIVVGTGCTGIVENNAISITGGGVDLICTTPAGLMFINNLFQGAADLSGYLLPVADV